jgi:peroxiredoxin family protein
MDIVLICRDALENSFLSNVGVAMEARRNGSSAGIVFTQEALAALAGGPLRWSPLLENRGTKIMVTKNATAMGLPLASEKDKRWTDIHRLLKSAKEAGVVLMACPLWSKLLEVEGKLPPEISSIDSQTMFTKMKEAKIIIGGF